MKLHEIFALNPLDKTACSLWLQKLHAVFGFGNCMKSLDWIFCTVLHTTTPNTASAKTVCRIRIYCMHDCHKNTAYSILKYCIVLEFTTFESTSFLFHKIKIIHFLLLIVEKYYCDLGYDGWFILWYGMKPISTVKCHKNHLQLCFRDGNNIHDKHNITSNSNFATIS